MLYLCIGLKHYSIMNKDLLNDFNAFRRWFNQRFSLSLNGKFAGLMRLKNWKLFAYRLYKEMNGRFRRPTLDVIVMHISGQSIKLYNR